MNNQTLKSLVSKNKDVVAPMLLSGSMYSNFWGGMDGYYYLRTDEYQEILDMKKLGCFPVPLVHSAVLVSLKKRKTPTFHRFNDSIPEDDIILFAMNAKKNGIQMEICNDIEYGYILSPLQEDSELSQDLEQLVNLRVEIAGSFYCALCIQKFTPWLT